VIFLMSVLMRLLAIQVILTYTSVYALVINLVIMLCATLIIASLTLIERKILSLIQRRVGPDYVGYRGRLQYLADALKLFVKGVILPNEVTKFWFVTIPSVVAALCYTIWVNSIWGPSVGLFEIEYNLVFASILSLLFGFCVILTGYFSKSKYAFIASIRSILMLLNLEIFLGLFILNLLLLSESFSFMAFSAYQQYIWFCWNYIGMLGVIIVIFLLETNRAPFDLAEAESELVTGYTVEYGGFYFALYYLGEYFHLFFFSTFIVFVIFGGWEFLV
jgi:NADH-quinone oxidoreductase subunit H